MKLVKSLLLSSAAGITAVASAQAADLPFRKAAPVEYVRVCDYTGAGYFYIPGTDTCLKFEGYAQMNFAYIDPTRAFVPFTLNAGAGGTNGLGDRTSGFVIRSANRNATGFKAEGRLAVDARTQTAYGTLRTYVRFQADAGGGLYTQNLTGAAVTNPNLASGTTNAAYVDKVFVQFAGFTAGRVQSFFDFYADNFNYESIANSDASNEVFAYTATFGGGFSATIAAEDATARRNIILQTNDPLNTTGVTLGNTGGVAYGGEELPDFVGVLAVDQAWGRAQLSAAYHQVRVTDTQNGLAFNPSTGVVESIGGLGTQDISRDGFAVQAGIQIKLPMLAAGDNLWLQGAYQQGAYLYQDTAGFANGGFNSLAVGGFIHRDGDAIAFRNVNGSVSLSLGEGFSVAGAFQHFFTPTFSDVLFGSYQEISYGNRSRNTDWTLGGIGDSDSWRIGNQFLWTPVNNMVVGIEVIYMQVNQDLAHNPGVAATSLAGLGIDKDPSAFEGRLRVERDF